uniref:Glucose-6-phosphate 1-dehydrogenase n=1 Tax=Rhodosorus marinus TaxID=101924 RepID=A0A7S0G0U2_9RHOD|mmetsp:Transcript_1778/g.2735  ORF Transcript_1778/g.2735 Transcript_1778/m.2735 type:complete len:508 (+) Transcript_1778:67-1590(+)
MDSSGKGAPLARHGSNPDLTVIDDENARVKEFKDPTTIVVVGASGDLAHKKTFPALFSLYYHGLLPQRFHIVGYARKALDLEGWRSNILLNLACRVLDQKDCATKMEEFIERLSYISGQYDSADDFAKLDAYLEDLEDKQPTGRLFYLAIPPNVFGAAMGSIKASAIAKNAWTRVVVEKPFGRDTESYMELRNQCAAHFQEEQLYRIDHYVGKEVVQNMVVLRFANFIFEQLWCKENIRDMHIIFEENFGTEGRAGYFDQFGIIRDIMQNHLLQVLAYLTMERPKSLHAADINRVKTKLLSEIMPLKARDFVVGQYEGYREEDGVPEGSVTPTFAACVMYINNQQWEGVPFFLTAGKNLHNRKAEVRVRFKKGHSMDFFPGEEVGNEIIIRIQPDEAVSLRVVNKVPGLAKDLAYTSLDLLYKDAFEKESKDIADAYERLILDAIHGEKSLFVHDEQLRISWELFTPALKELESEDSPVKPVLYTPGSKGPPEADDLRHIHRAMVEP